MKEERVAVVIVLCAIIILSLAFVAITTKSVAAIETAKGIVGCTAYGCV